MIKKTRKTSRLWIGLNVILIAAIIAEGVLCLHLSRGNTELKETLVAQEEKLQQQEEELTATKNKLKKRNIQLKEKTQEVETLNEKLSASASAAGEIQGPSPDGSSVFTSTGFLGNVGNVVGEEALSQLSSYFGSYEILRDGEIFQRINGRSYQDNPDIALEELRYLRVLHYNFDHQLQIGELIVHRDLAEEMLMIFQELLQQQYEIYSMHLVDDYWVEGGDGNDADYASIEVNNTSCFNYRPISGGGKLSYHGYGRAIDINPMNNPYVTASGNYSHDNAAPYLDRNSGDPHVIVEGDPCYQIFAAHGFEWGGSWYDPIDYQHFQKPAA